MQRDIHLGDEKFKPIPNDNLNGWLTANNIDPKSLPINQVVAVYEKYIVLTVFIFNEDGTKLLNRGGDAGYLKELRTVPLLSAPEDHNL
jgi:hypothetical protein